jgi:hypothetical protein
MHANNMHPKGMNKYACILIALPFSGLAQEPVVDGSAWQSTTLPGTRNTATSEVTGQEVAKPAKSSNNVVIFLEYKPTENIHPVRVWIDGRAYKATFQSVKNDQVVMQNQGQTDTLVKKTFYRIIRVQPSVEQTVKVPAAVLRTSTNHNVIIEYLWKSRKHYYTISVIKKYGPVPLE